MNTQLQVAQAIFSRQVLICQHKSCRRFGATAVLAAFQTQTLSNTEIKPVRCLGQCGNGPMVLILPEQTWYWHVLPAEVELISQQHLQGDRPVTALLYPKFHALASREYLRRD